MYYNYPDSIQSEIEREDRRHLQRKRELYSQPIVNDEGEVISYADWEERTKNY